MMSLVKGQKSLDGKASENCIKIAPMTEACIETEEQLLVLIAGMHSDFLMKSFVYSCNSLLNSHLP